MNLLGIRPRDKKHDVVQEPTCPSTCIELGEYEHVRRHLQEDFALACQEASEFHRVTWMCFALFEQTASKSLRDDVTRCSHKESAATLISAADASWVMDLISELVDIHSGVHLSYRRDITTGWPETTYVIYEIMVEAGFTLPST